MNLDIFFNLEPVISWADEVDANIPIVTYISTVSPKKLQTNKMNQVNEMNQNLRCKYCRSKTHLTVEHNLENFPVKKRKKTIW